MYSTIAFAISMLGIFSIFENIKRNPKFSLLKLYMLLTTICLTVASFMDFLDLNGYEVPYYKKLTRIIGAILIINMLFFSVVKKIPKIFIKLEVFYVVFFIIEFFLGFQFPEIKNGKIIMEFKVLHILFYAVNAFTILSSLVYLTIHLYKNKASQNFYDRKVTNWVAGLLTTIFLIGISQIILVVFLVKGVNTFYKDSIINLFLIRTSLLLFILFRPKFLDNDGFSRSFNQLYKKNSFVSFDEFEFLFYKNHYYLNAEANLDDFALKLNRRKEEITEFIKLQLDQNFTELLNQNRVEYLKQLLRSRKYESFTIEALSEMSGFGSRRSMYNYFNKYVGMTPSEFINSIK